MSSLPASLEFVLEINGPVPPPKARGVCHCNFVCQLRKFVKLQGLSITVL
jgi:hypothetical protein